MSLRRERSCRNVLLLLPCGAGCLGNPSTGQLRAAELCLRSVGLLFFPCLYLCPQGLLEPVHPFEPRAPLAAQAGVPGQLARAGANWSDTKHLGNNNKEKKKSVLAVPAEGVLPAEGLGLGFELPPPSPVLS